MYKFRDECASCGLFKFCKTPWFESTGSLDAPVLIILDNPGEEEDSTSTPLVGKGVQLLVKNLCAAGLTEDMYRIDYLLQCRPPDNTDPTKAQIATCSKHINLGASKVIVTVGGNVYKSLTGNKTGIMKARGTLHELEDGRLILPTISPGYILKGNPAAESLLASDLRHVAAILKGDISEGTLGTYELITTPDDVVRAFSEVLASPIVAIDLETDGVNLHHPNFKIATIGLSIRPGHAYVIPFDHSEFICSDEMKQYIGRVMCSILSDTNKIKVFHNATYDAKVLRHVFGAVLELPYDDTMVMHHIIDSSKGTQGLDFLIETRTNMPRYWDELNVWKKENLKAKDQYNYSLITLPVIVPYNGGDCDALLRLLPDLNKDLDSLTTEEGRDGRTLYEMVRKPQIKAIIDMELDGMQIDSKYYWEELMSETSPNSYTMMVGKICKEIAAIPEVIKWEQARSEENAQIRFNPGSPDQVGDLLFGDLKLPCAKITDKGKKSTKKEVLQEIEYLHPLPRKILEYRGATKIFSTYVKPIPDLMDVQERIHPHFVIIGTSAGRMCVSGDTVLGTDKGSIKISELDLTGETKYSILTHRGRYAEITNLWYKGIEEMYDVVLKNGCKITCTANHRFLTPMGWKRLNEIHVGEAIYSVGDYTGTTGAQTVRWKKSDFTRRHIRARICDRKTHDKRVFSKVSRDQSSCSYNLKKVLQQQVQGAIEIKQAGQLCQEQAWKHTWQERNSSISYTAGKARTFSSGRKETLCNCTGTRHNRMVCSQKYRDVQFISLWRTSFQTTAYRYRVSRKVRGIFPRSAKGSERVLSESARVFSSTLSCVLKGTRTNLVHKTKCEGLSTLRRNKASQAGSHLFFDKSIRTIGIDGTSVQKDTSYSRICVCKKYANGLWLSRKQAVSGNRWRYPHEFPMGTEIRSKERSQSAGIRVQGISGEQQEGINRFGWSNSGNRRLTESTVATITPVGSKEVWDITVKGDHSYVAHGFINHNSSNHPNGQNLPKLYKIKRMFVSRFEGGKLCIFDESQMELRVLACTALSGCRTLRESIARNEDLHYGTAKVLFPDEQFGKESWQRDTAKTFNFAVIYGRGMGAIKRTLQSIFKRQMSWEEVQCFYDTYFSKMPEVKDFIERSKAMLFEKGYVPFLSGMTRHLPNVWSDKEFEVAEACRQIVNGCVQGPAAEVTNWALSQISFFLKSENMQSKVVCTVHDSIVIDTHPDELELIKEIVPHFMLNPPFWWLDVPLVVDCKILDNWGMGEKDRPKEGTPNISEIGDHTADELTSYDEDEEDPNPK